jgi:hypothetical protein
MRNKDYLKVIYRQIIELESSIINSKKIIFRLYGQKKKAIFQFGGSEWVTMIDPAGHPFCLCAQENKA